MAAALELFSQRRHSTNIIQYSDTELETPETLSMELETEKAAILQLIAEVRKTVGTSPSIIEILQNFSDRFQFSNVRDENNLQVKTWLFNPIDNRTRFQELEATLHKNSSLEERQELFKKKRAMLWGNFWTYLEEYVLYKPFTSFNYELSAKSQDQITLEGFEFTGLIDLCEKSTNTYSKRKIKLNRLKVEQVIYGKVLHEIVHNLPVGTEFFICSPPGNKREGYLGKKSYSFIFFYKIVEDPQTKQKKVQLHQYSRWMTLQDHVDFIEKFGGYFDQELALNDKNVILHPSLLKEGYSETDVVTYLDQFKSRTPKKYQQKQINEVEFKQQAELLFDQFYFPLFDQLAQQPLTQESVEKMELALSFAVRGLLRWIDDDELFQTGKSDNEARPISEIKDIPELKKLFDTHAKATIDKTLKFKTEAEKQAHLSGLGLHFGKNLSSIFQAGQCYGGLFTNLTRGLQTIKQGIHTRFDIAKVVGSKEAKDWKNGLKCQNGDCKNIGWVGPCNWCAECDGRFRHKSIFDLGSPTKNRSAISSPLTELPSAKGMQLTPSASVGLNYLLSGAAA